MSAKYRSAIYAVLVYITLLLLLFSYFSHQAPKEKSIHYVKKNDNHIAVGLSTAPAKQTPTISKPKPKPKKVVKKDNKPKKKSTPKKRKPIPPKKVVKSKKPIEKKKVEKAKPRLKKLFENIKEKKPSPQNKEHSEVKNNENRHITSSMKNIENKDKGVINEYFAKVEETLYYWPALSGFEGERAEIWLKIEKDGSFVFRLTKRSNNPDFNSGLIQYLQQLQRVGFARHKYTRPLEAKVEFIAQE